MENIAWLTICAICGSDKGEFNEEFMDIICPECAEFSSLTIAGNVMRHKKTLLFEFEGMESSEAMKAIVEEVTLLTGISAEKIKENNRKSEIVEARHIAMVAVKNRTKINVNKIPGLVANKDHACIYHAMKYVSNRMDTEPLFREKYSKVLGL